MGIIERSGLPLQRDVWIGAAFVLLLLESARRSLGLALPALAAVFLLYCFVGPYLPRFLAHPGIPLEFIVDHMYLSDSGIWGVPLGVSTDFVFLFVLFGALLDRAGAAEYFVQVAFAMLGRFRGGPAKAAVLASGLTGMVSGSSIANVATTGTFTIPLMKRVGLPAYKGRCGGGGRQHQRPAPASGHGGRGLHHGRVPGGCRTSTSSPPRPFRRSCPTSPCCTWCTWKRSSLDLIALPEEELPKFWPTFLGGFHFLIPILALIYTLVILRFSAVSAAFNAILLTLVIMVIQRVVQSCAAVLRPSPDKPGRRLPGAGGMAGSGPERPRDPARLRVRRPQHGAHRGGHRGRRHHRGHRHPDRTQQPLHRGHRDHLPGQRGAHCCC